MRRRRSRAHPPNFRLVSFTAAASGVMSTSTPEGGWARWSRGNPGSGSDRTGGPLLVHQPLVDHVCAVHHAPADPEAARTHATGPPVPESRLRDAKPPGDLGESQKLSHRLTSIRSAQCSVYLPITVTAEYHR